jgi:hypothetical protein
MSNQVIVHKGRTNTLLVDLGINVSADTITSEIRSEPNSDAAFIATWVVTKVDGGVNGELIFTLDDTFTSQISANSGYMDVKRVSNGEPVPVFDKPLEVVFRGTVTV